MTFLLSSYHGYCNLKSFLLFLILFPKILYTNVTYFVRNLVFITDFYTKIYKEYFFTKYVSFVFFNYNVNKYITRSVLTTTVSDIKGRIKSTKLVKIIVRMCNIFFVLVLSLQPTTSLI